MSSANELLSTGRPATGTSGPGVAAAVGMHKYVMRVYEQACNAYTFDFESDVGRFMPDDVTVISGGVLGTRSLLCETLEARADYVRGTGATVTINLDVTCVAELDTTVVLVAEGDLTFTYPDWTTYSQRVLISSTVRLVDGMWGFQHIHFGGDFCW